MKNGIIAALGVLAIFAVLVLLALSFNASEERGRRERPAPVAPEQTGVLTRPGAQLTPN